MSSARPVRPAASRIAGGTSEKWRPSARLHGFGQQVRAQRGPSAIAQKEESVSGAERLPDREGRCLAATQSLLVGAFGQDATRAFAVEEIRAGVACARSDGDSVQQGHPDKSALRAAQEGGVQELNPAGPDAFVRDLLGLSNPGTTSRTGSRLVWRRVGHCQRRHKERCTGWRRDQSGTHPRWYCDLLRPAGRVTFRSHTESVCLIGSTEFGVLRVETGAGERA